MATENFYQHALARLAKIYDRDEAKAILKLLLEHFDYSMPDSFFENTGSISATEAKMEQALNRLLVHEPLQYVLGETWFYKLRFQVNNSVLIPRPETEELVEIAIQYLRPRHRPKVLDIGTGSGCIAIAICKNVITGKVIAVDISKDALEVARSNAEMNGCEIAFLQMNFLLDELPSLATDFDLIISNPPYIPDSEGQDMAQNVTGFEPKQALFVPDNNPLIFYKRIGIVARERLRADGIICLEVHENYGEEVMALFNSMDFAAVLKKDMSGKSRFVIASHSR